MSEFFSLLKHGNKPSLMAGFINLILGIIKGVAYFFTGNVAMFAEMMHSLGDAANQFFVFVGSALSKKAPTRKFPTGFGRVINLVCLFAVIIVGILAYETILEGFHHILNPTTSTGVWIVLSVLALGILLEGAVLLKACHEINTEVGVQAKGMTAFIKAIHNLGRAKPATKLVFMEDTVATLGNVLAFIAVLIAHYTPFVQIEGIVSMIIGAMMFIVVGTVFLENARGAIGETDEEMLNHIAYLVSDNEHVKDIRRLEVIKEGEALHVELMAEINPSVTVAFADDVRDDLMKLILAQKGVSRATIYFDEDDGVTNWSHIGERPESLKTEHANLTSK
ncbi:cation diffusion facilitator family transporter [Kurthia huakuii]|uniref:cation diffusion facilitator family transporter n=1 Tax=Kurthia huakuii TaxID=1421019 RepID=UPI000496606F|nr:cation diffusion facilitator family transporter [Kurthia huakuii]MBM7700281.1 cation diffusion facilitator family transporter [Kurthia huakuii]